jgi:undecaprenyl-diphosphatase
MIELNATPRRIGTSIICAIVASGLACWFALDPSPTDIDLMTARSAAGAPEGLVPALRAVTWLGASVTVASAAALVGAVVFAKDRDVEAVAYLAIVVAAELILANAMKHVVDRPRPQIDQLVGWSGSSFPSGHSAAAAAVYLAIALVILSRSPGSGGWLVAGAVGIAVAVAMSRVFLGVHWTTDVVGGLALGWTIALSGCLLVLSRGRPPQKRPARRIDLGRPSGSKNAP